MADEATPNAEQDAAAPVERPDSPPPSPDGQQAADSLTYSRCAKCGHAREVDPVGGTLLCARHNMRVDAEADEIPDDCAGFEADPGRAE